MTSRNISINKRNISASKEQNAKVNKNVINIANVDYTLLLVVILLLLIGIVMIFSAGYYWAISQANDVFHLLKRQSFLVILGFSVMVFMSYFNYRHLMKFVLPLYLGVNILLIVVAMFGTFMKGARRSIQLPFIGEFQPLEFAKISIILTVAYVIYKNKNILKNAGGFIFVSALVGITSLLVFLGSLSSAIIVTVIGFGIIFVASPHITRFVVVSILGGAGVGLFVAVLSDDFRGARFNAWLDPFAYPKEGGYQIINSLYAIATGGPFGIGLGQSRQKSFIPEPFNDFIFAIVIEEVGYIGASLIIFLFGILIWRGINIAINAPDLFGSLIASGVVIMIASQVVINVAVVTNSMPNTGIPMPFISYGGSSLIVTLFLVGILLNISRYSRE